MTTAPNKVEAKRRAAQPVTVPAGAKQPMDHQSAKEDATGPKDVTVWWPPVEGAAESHSYFISGEALDDLELLETFNDGNFAKALQMLLGPEGWQAYKDNNRNERGRVTASGAAEFLEHALKEVKRGNS
jgi:hypothetical protein